MLHRNNRSMKVHQNRKNTLARTGILFCGALLMALWAEVALQAQNAPVVKTPAQVAEEEAVRRQEATVQIRSYLDKADAARAKGDWSEASRLYSDAYKTLSQVGSSSSATAEYRRIATGITDVSVYEAEQAMKRNDYELAIEKLDYALRVDPTSIKAQRARESAIQKRALAKNRVTSREVREYGNDVQETNDEVNQMVHDAKMLYEMGAYQKAQEKLSAVLKIAPDNGPAQYYQKLLEEKNARNIMRQRGLVSDSSIVDVARAWTLTTNAQNLPIPNIMASTNLVSTGMGRQKIFNKLNRITVGEVKFDGIPLGEVARWLQEQSIKNDPDGEGINFIINNVTDKPYESMSTLYNNFNEIDPTTGAPRIGTAAMMGSGMGGMGGGMGGMSGQAQVSAFDQIMMNMGDVREFVIRIDPPLRHVRLLDALDAITKVSDRPLKYSVEDYAIMFTQRMPVNAQFFNRQYKVDPNTFWQGLVSVSSEEVGVEGSNSSGTSSSSGGSATGGYVARVYAAGNSSGSGMGGGGNNSGGLPYVTMELDSGMVQERVRLFFQSVTGVPFTTGSYSSQGVGMMMMAGGGLQALSGQMQGGMGGNNMMSQMQGQQSGSPQPGHSLVFNDRRGLLWVRSTTEVLDVIEQVIQTLNAPPPQLSIEVKFVEVGQNDSKALGFDWYLGNFTIGGGKVGASGGAAPVYQGEATENNPLGYFPSYSDATPQTTGNITSGLAENNSSIPTIATITGILTDPQFRVVIRALESRDGVEVMSAPRLVTLSGRQAQIQSATLRNIATDADVSASEVSSSSGTSVSGGTSATVQALGMVQPESAAVSTGPTLDVIPYVSADGYSVQMSLIPSVVNFLGYGNPDVPEAAEFESSLQAQAGNVSSPIPLPRFQVRQVTTSVIVWDGQTVMLGGLISEDVSRARKKVPVLGDIPLLGRLFRSESTSSAKKNLIIFVSPQIIDPAGNPVHDLNDIENLPYNPNSVPVQTDSNVLIAPGTVQASR